MTTGLCSDWKRPNSQALGLQGTTDHPGTLACWEPPLIGNLQNLDGAPCQLESHKSLSSEALLPSLSKQPPPTRPHVSYTPGAADHHPGKQSSPRTYKPFTNPRMKSGHPFAVAYTISQRHHHLRARILLFSVPYKDLGKLVF